MAHGAARGLDDIPRYYAHIRHGQPLSPAVLRELSDRYRAIGGYSPLHEITAALARRLAGVLGVRPGVVDWHVYHGFRHAPPFIADAVAAMAADGVQRGIGVVLAPHDSALSGGRYRAAAEEARAAVDGAPPFTYVASWHLEPRLVHLLASRVREAQAYWPEAERDAVPVVFTAHSLPERIRAEGDSYADQVRATARAVADLAGLAAWEVAWQSAGRTGEPWMGPDILEVVDRLAGEGRPGVLVCPLGFVADHLEVLYDLDIQAAAAAAARGLRWRRTRSLNDDPALAEVLADIVEREVVLRA
ncbi:MAG: ferrochelatase [Actinomycetia bacterium]|nr:ferrochelatase [Actinomycetes bacterium]